MAKVINGLADNLLTNIFRAWDISAGSCVMVPTMNKYMFQNPMTGIQIKKLTNDLNVKLVCGMDGIDAQKISTEVRKIM